MNIRVLRFFAALNLVGGFGWGLYALLNTLMAGADVPVGTWLYAVLAGAAGVLAWAVLSALADITEATRQRGESRP